VNEIHSQACDQGRWNASGRRRVRQLRKRPNDFLITDNPLGHREYGAFLGELLHPVGGKDVLEVGVGKGNFACFLAKQGALVSGIDVGANLVSAARLLAEINQVSCRFEQASVSQLPFPDEAFDIVVGTGVLHHLRDRDLSTGFLEIHRVLRKPGVAIFCEPVENSRALDLLQQLVPVGRGRHRRPARWQRRAWRDFQARCGERGLTTALLQSVGEPFREVRLYPFGFLSRLERLIHKPSPRLRQIDQVLLAKVPPLRYLCRLVVVEYRK
jgi:2-polyprenyl-3-methyl-5-hydroxy-6-metoxy-1,4-benzoquinol methylase